MISPADQRLRTPARAMLVSGHPVLAETVRTALEQGCFSARIAHTRDEAAATIAQWRPHVAIVDIDAASGATLDWIQLPSGTAHQPAVIALTRHADLQTKLSAFERGVDDVVTVPFCTEELMARALAVMRRTYQTAVEFAPVLRIGELEIDIKNRHVRAAGMELHLTALERSLLYLLAANAGQLLTRDEILDRLWGADYVAESNVVDRHIRNLRMKLQSHTPRPYIATVRGLGYRFWNG